MAKKKKKSRLKTILMMLFTAVSGGGVSGYLKPDLPVIGPFIHKLVSRVESVEGIGSGGGLQAAATLASGTANSPLNMRGGQGAAQPASASLGASQRPTDSLLIASYNIQVLGRSKMAKPEVVDVLAKVIRQFHIVAIQEVRAKDDNVLPELLAAINADGSQYNFLIGPRLGRSVSTEQYAFVYDTTRVEHDPSSVGTMMDPSDLLHREPFVARFRARTQSPDQAFTFWLVNTHTDPDEVKQEVAALADVFVAMQAARADEDDVILLGDLNASEKQLGKISKIPGISWAVTGAMTNTRQNKSYDNIIFQGAATSEFTGRWGVVDIEGMLGLSRDAALKVSDHLPVWAEFRLWEGAASTNVAGRLRGNPR